MEACQGVLSHPVECPGVFLSEDLTTCQGLVEDGLVERLPSATDKRMVTLSLTNQGREMAAKVGAPESQFYETNAGLVKDARLPELLEILWRFVEGRPVGMALARRMGREAEGEMLAL